MFICTKCGTIYTTLQENKKCAMVNCNDSRVIEVDKELVLIYKTLINKGYDIFYDGSKDYNIKIGLGGIVSAFLEDNQAEKKKFKDNISSIGFDLSYECMIVNSDNILHSPRACYYLISLITDGSINIDNLKHRCNAIYSLTTFVEDLDDITYFYKKLNK